jgi:hypothetical protein
MPLSNEIGTAVYAPAFTVTGGMGIMRVTPFGCSENADTSYVPGSSAMWNRPSVPVSKV